MKTPVGSKGTKGSPGRRVEVTLDRDDYRSNANQQSKKSKYQSAKNKKESGNNLDNDFESQSLTDSLSDDSRSASGRNRRSKRKSRKSKRKGKISPGGDSDSSDSPDSELELFKNKMNEKLIEIDDVDPERAQEAGQPTRMDCERMEGTIRA